MTGALGSNLQRAHGLQDQAAHPSVRENPTALPAFQAAHHLTSTSHVIILALFMTFQHVSRKLWDLGRAGGFSLWEEVIPFNLNCL